jgi:hypothetical protein
MFMGILVLITALTISSVAIYYSVAGLVAIFAAASIPIIIMGASLEIGKLVTAVWLHRYWKQASWWLKTYLTIAVFVLMFITSMGIFGFLSKAHIEQTAGAQESVAQVERLGKEIKAQEAVIIRAQERIKESESSVGNSNDAVQAQIDKEQTRIDTAYTRIESAIVEQNNIINNARTDDASRTKPYEEQLTNIQAEVLRLENSASEYEQKITTLEADSGAIQPLLDSITDIEEEIIRVTNQLQSSERDQIRAGQAIIGVSSDGAFGGNTRKALAAWVEAQRARITQVQLDVSQLRQDATAQVDAERTRLADVVNDIRTTKIPALKERELTMLSKIDEVRSTESPIIATARDEIGRIRSSADAQVIASQELIQKLRDSLTVGKDATVEEVIDQQQKRIVEANNTIDTLTQQKYTLEAEYRKLEAEVGPLKYLAEFIYGETANQDLLESAVRWVIIVIIFVFDPLAVLLLIASQYTFEFRKENKERLRAEQERKNYEQARAQRMVENPGWPIKETKDEITNRSDDEQSDRQTRTADTGGDTISGTTDNGGETLQANETTPSGELARTEDLGRHTTTGVDEDIVKRLQHLEDLENTEPYKIGKMKWKQDNPDQSIKFWKDQYIKGKVNELPWDAYVQNAEQGDNSIWNRIRSKDE